MYYSSIPVSIERRLELIGVLPPKLTLTKSSPDYDRKETLNKSFFRMPIFNEQGEPDF